MTAHGQQPDTFVFDDTFDAEARKVIARYPEGKQASAVMPLLDLAQRQFGGWLPTAAMNHVADVLDEQQIEVVELPSGDRLGDHFSLEMAHRAGEDLANRCARHRETIGVVLGRKVARHRSHPDSGMECSHGPLQQLGLSGTCGCLHDARTRNVQRINSRLPVEFEKVLISSHAAIPLSG